jgi:hypothetical protein
MAKQSTKIDTTTEEDEDPALAVEEDVAGAHFENNEDGLVVNLAEVEEMKFDLLPKNIYDVIVQDNVYKLSKSSGQPMWETTVNVLTESHRNRKLFANLSFSPKALPGTKAALIVLNPSILSGPFRVDDPEIVASIIGQRARVKVNIQPGTAEYPNDRNNIQRWMQPEGAGAFIGGQQEEEEEA